MKLVSEDKQELILPEDAKGKIAFESKEAGAEFVKENPDKVKDLQEYVRVYNAEKEGALVVVTRSTEKAGPSLMVAGDFQKGVVIEFGNKLILTCQVTASFPGGTPCYLSGSYRFFAGGRVFFFGSVRSCSRSSLS